MVWREFSYAAGTTVYEDFGKAELITVLETRRRSRCGENIVSDSLRSDARAAKKKPCLQMNRLGDAPFLIDQICRQQP